VLYHRCLQLIFCPVIEHPQDVVVSKTRPTFAHNLEEHEKMAGILWGSKLFGAMVRGSLTGGWV
jgi:hypothetical protein